MSGQPHPKPEPDGLVEEAPDLLRAALPWQLRPHFVFNALHAIATLTRQGEADRSVRLVTALGDLLQRSLEARGEDVTLEEEVSFASCYLAVEEARSGHDIEPRFELEEPAGRALVPCFLLQPIVEDLARMARAVSPGHRSLLVRARALHTRLDIEVRSTGAVAGEPPGVPRARPIGTHDLRERLEARYGAAYRLALVSDASGGGIARLRMPYLPAREARSAPAPPASALGC